MLVHQLTGLYCPIKVQFDSIVYGDTKKYFSYETEYGFI